MLVLTIAGLLLGMVGCSKETGEENKISHVPVHDPSVFREVDENGKVTYYVYGTHITSAKSDNLAESFQWAGENDADCKGGFAVWAPDLVYNENYIKDDGSKGAYLLYYSVSSTYCRSAIGYAVADTVEDPFTYKGTIVYSGFSQVSAKDAKSNIDKIWTNTNIDKYFGTRIAGGFTISGEGPYILYDEATGYYYLYTTYNYLDSVSGYNMRLFRSENPQGPYLDAAGNNAAFESRHVNQYEIGIKVMGNYN